MKNREYSACDSGSLAYDIIGRRFSMEQNASSKSSSEQKVDRKVYSKPTVQVYGTLPQMSRSTHTDNHAIDGPGSTPNHRT